MKTIIIKTTLLCTTAISLQAVATTIADYSFKSPSFNGQGYGTYNLTIENEQYTRQQAILSALESAKQAAKADAKNQPINQFLTNLESRVYAQISQNLATAMFANGGTNNSGTLNFEGNTIFWSKDGQMVNLQVTDSVGNVTSVAIPLGQFTFPSGAAQ